MCFYSGVLWSGDNIIGQANDALNKLRSLGKKIFYVTNNSTKSREEYVKKCEKLGFIASKVCLNILILEVMLNVSHIWYVLSFWYNVELLFHVQKDSYLSLIPGLYTLEWLVFPVDLIGIFCAQEEIVSSSFVMAQYLKQQGFNKKVYVVGTSGMTAELDNVGIAHTDIGVRLSNETKSLW